MVITLPLSLLSSVWFRVSSVRKLCRRKAHRSGLLLCAAGLFPLRGLRVWACVLGPLGVCPKSWGWSFELTVMLITNKWILLAYQCLRAAVLFFPCWPSCHGSHEMRSHKNKTKRNFFCMLRGKKIKILTLKLEIKRKQWGLAKFLFYGHDDVF